MGLDTPKGAKEAITAARARIQRFAHVTPVMTSRRLNAIAGAELFFKCENLQRAGAFKTRGAFNAVMSLSDADAARGVYTHSSGNHGAALALAARTRGVPCHVVMPSNAAEAKHAAVDGYGAEIHVCEPTLAAREAVAARVGAETGARFIHPYDNEAIIAGQGTAAAELIEQVPELEIVTAPIGGGGLISGTALAVKAFAPKARVIGAEPAGADDAAQSFARGQLVPQANPQTIADGLRASLSERTFRIIGLNVAEIRTTPELSIVDAMRLVWSAMKLVIEPSAAVPLAAILEHPKPFAGRRVGVILTGGNVDLDALPWTAGGQRAR
ncbi:MAG TPA: pyridoxal-phosphate dependent enzyme [Caulobacteraceae bacterium]|nr:pyridoxal-phosphate dependent enzyme [Caulobacteraceae bacterium]